MSRGMLLKRSIVYMGLALMALTAMAQSKAFMGVFIDKIGEEKAEILGTDNPYGSYVTGISKNSPAEEAGIMVLDYIYGIDEYRVGYNQSMIDIIHKYTPGDKVELHILRRGEKISRDLKFASYFAGKKATASRKAFLGVDLIDSKSHGYEYGLKIRVIDHSSAQKMGMKSNDVITRMNGFYMIDWSDLTHLLSMLEPGMPMEIDVIRNNRHVLLQGPLGSRNGDHSRDIEIHEELRRLEYDREIDAHAEREVEEEWLRQLREKELTAKIDGAKKIKLYNAILTKVDAEGDEPVFSRIPKLDHDQMKVMDLEIWKDEGNGVFSIGFHLPQEGNTTVQIYQHNGQLLYDNYLHEFFGSYTDNVDITRYGPSEFYLVIDQNGHKVVRKIILTKK